MKTTIRKYGIVANVIVVGLVLILFLFPVLQTLENALYDFDLEHTTTGEPHENIRIIAIDDYSIEQIGQFPWPRDIYGVLIDNLNQPGNEPAAIAFDIMFDTETIPEVDDYFAEALARYDNVILPVTGVMESTLSKVTQIEKGERIQVQALIQPIPKFYENSLHAHINAIIDSDGTIRKNWLELRGPNGEAIPSLAYKATEMTGAKIDHFLDYDDQAEIYIDFKHESLDFWTIPFFDILTGAVPPDIFKDTIVLVGFTAVGLNTEDSGTVPIESRMPLIYAHANIVDQLLNDRYITYIPDLYVFLIALLLFALTVYATWKLKTVVSVGAVFGFSILLLIGQFYLFETTQVFLDTVNPIAVMLLTFVPNIAVKAYFETKHKNFITKQFGRYISPDLVKEISKSDKELPLGGINKELSILFLDIRGFTTLSEKMKPEEVVDFLNMMFNLITEKTLENHGTIDKFIGDAAMLIFNAPLDLQNHEYYAVKTAYDIQKGMERVREEIQSKHGVTVNVGIGVNTGVVVVGNIGSYIRVDYTAIGDNVNIAARIESNTTAGQILVSEETYNRTKEYFDYTCIGERMMKGKTVAVKLYEVVGLKQELKTSSSTN